MWAVRATRVVRRAALVLLLAAGAAVLLLLPTRPAPPHAHLQRARLLLPSRARTDFYQPPDDDVDYNLIENPAVKIIQQTEVGYSEKSTRPYFFRGGKAKPVPKPDDSYKLFPEDAPDDDRIVQQLMYTFDQSDTPIKTILVPNGFRAWNTKGGRSDFIRDKCPVDRCTLVSNINQASTADAILFKDYVNLSDVKRPKNQIWILYYLESPYHTAALRGNVLDQFNWTATYRRDSDLVTPYEKWVYYDSPAVKSSEFNYAANKTKKVAWFVSNCLARNRRLQYARQLGKHIQVDIYGACGSLQCPRSDPNCLKMLDTDYKFYLAFENSNCKDYITEKFFVNGLQHNAIPIVMGGRPVDYAASGPHNSYIHIEEFAGPEELAAYLHRLDNDDTLYNSYFQWKGTGEFINTFFMCRLCAMLHAAERTRRVRQYTDVQAWWRERACTKVNWRPDFSAPAIATQTIALEVGPTESSSSPLPNSSPATSQQLSSPPPRVSALLSVPNLPQNTSNSSTQLPQKPSPTTSLSLPLQEHNDSVTAGNVDNATFLSLR